MDDEQDSLVPNDEPYIVTTPGHDNLIVKTLHDDHIVVLNRHSGFITIYDRNDRVIHKGVLDLPVGTKLGTNLDVLEATGNGMCNDGPYLLVDLKRSRNEDDKVIVVNLSDGQIDTISFPHVRDTHISSVSFESLKSIGIYMLTEFEVEVVLSPDNSVDDDNDIKQVTFKLTSFLPYI